MKRFRPISLSFFLMLLAGFPLSAQNAMDWDAALDNYDDICTQCISIREQIQSGEAVGSGVLGGLLNRLSELRKTLSGAKGAMSFDQQRRFDAIRERYARAFNPALLPDTSIRLDGAPAARLDTGWPVPPPDPPADADVLRRGFHPLWHPAVHAFVSLPVWAPGLMFTVDNTRWGLYAKGCVSPSPARGDYSCRSDGVSDEGIIWTTGKERRFRYGASAGAIGFPLPCLGLYAGGGYGRTSVFWEDTSRRWAEVEDLTVKGPVLDAGALFRWKRLSVFAGASTVAFRSWSADAGVGVRF